MEQRKRTEFNFNYQNILFFFLYIHLLVVLIIHKFHLKSMKQHMKKKQKKIVRNLNILYHHNKRAIQNFLVAPIDGTIISHLISQVK